MDLTAAHIDHAYTMKMIATSKGHVRIYRVTEDGQEATLAVLTNLTLR